MFFKKISPAIAPNKTNQMHNSSKEPAPGRPTPIHLIDQEVESVLQVYFSHAAVDIQIE